ncbi:hypothetical protein [Streptomyces nigrescens]
MSQTSEALRLGSNALDAYEGRESSSGELAEGFSEAVRKLNAAETLVALEGPEEAAAEAAEMVTELYTWANSMDLGIALREGRFTGADWSVSLPELMYHRESSYEALATFTELCRRLLDS